MNARLGRIGAIVRKDLVEFGRDRFWAFMTVLGLVFYAAVFWLLPTSVDETVTVGVHGRGLGPVAGFVGGGAVQGFDLVPFASVDALRRAVAGEGDRDVAIGLDLPQGLAATGTSGDPATATVYLRADVPPELRTGVEGVLDEVAFALAGEQPPVRLDPTPVVVGTDRAGDQVSLREKIRPLIVFFGLMIEALALAALVAGEIQQRTVVAVLATPTRVPDFLAAKAVVGTLLAFGEALILLAVTASTERPDILLPTVLLGALLVTGFGLLAGSAGRDFLSIVFLSMLLLVPLAIPAVAVLFPGGAAAWVRVLPSYGLVEALVGVTAYGQGWAEVSGDLLGLTAWVVVAFTLGVLVLRRKVATL